MSEPEDKPTIILSGPAPAVEATEFVGVVLNGIYQVKRFVARGGMGEVYEGSAVNNDRDRVAIKIIRRELADDPNVQRMFRNEADTLMRLAHPGLVQYRVFARDGALDVYYIVTEFVDGPTLGAALQTLPNDTASLIALTARLASALGAAHELGRFHRDMCPDNVLLPKGSVEHAKIIDFGIAKKTADGNETFFTTQGAFVGRFRYSAPEQFAEREIGPWTDIYSMALVMLAVAGRKPPNMGSNFWEAVKQRQAVPDLSALPQELHPLFSRMLAPEAAQRPQSMSEVIAELGQIGKPKQAAPTQIDRIGGEKRTLSPPPGEQAEKSRLVPILGAAAAVLLLAGGGAYYFLAPSGGGNDAQLKLEPPRTADAAETAWNAVQASSDPVALGAFVKSYPTSVHVAEANQKIADLQRLAEARRTRAEAVERINASADTMTCRWLAHNYPENGNSDASRTIRVVLSGVGGAPAIIASQLQRAVTLPPDWKLDVDTAAVLPVQPAACAPLKAIYAKRDMAAAAAPALSVEQPRFALGQPAACPRGGQRQAEVNVTLKTGETQPDFSLVSILSDGRMRQVIPSRAIFDQMRKAGALKQAGGNAYTLTLCTSEAAAHDSPDGVFWLVLLKGAGPFQLGLKPAYERVPDDWAKQFTNLADAKGWATELAWYEVADPSKSSPAGTPGTP